MLHTTTMTMDISNYAKVRFMLKLPIFRSEKEMMLNTYNTNACTAASILNGKMYIGYGAEIRVTVIGLYVYMQLY